MTAPTNLTTKRKSSPRVEDLESRLLMTTFYPHPASSNSQAKVWDQAEDDLLKVDWDAALSQHINHRLQLEFTLDAAAILASTVTVAQDAHDNFNTLVAPPSAAGGTHSTFVNSGAKDQDGGTTSTDTTRFTRRTVKNVLSARADVAVAVKLAAYMK